MTFNQTRSNRAPSACRGDERVFLLSSGASCTVAPHGRIQIGKPTTTPGSALVRGGRRKLVSQSLSLIFRRK